MIVCVQVLVCMWHHAMANDTLKPQNKLYLAHNPGLWVLRGEGVLYRCMGDSCFLLALKIRVVFPYWYQNWWCNLSSGLHLSALVTWWRSGFTLASYQQCSTALYWASDVTDHSVGSNPLPTSPVAQHMFICNSVDLMTSLMLDSDPLLQLAAYLANWQA